MSGAITMVKLLVYPAGTKELLRSSPYRAHGKRFYEQAIADALIRKDFMGIVWEHL
jgi:hypothetical protein